jgi:hypothetical protein
VKDATTGRQAIWIDGNCTAEMQLPGNATGKMLPLSNITLDAGNRVALAIDLDEVVGVASLLS